MVVLAFAGLPGLKNFCISNPPPPPNGAPAEPMARETAFRTEFSGVHLRVENHLSD